MRSQICRMQSPVRSFYATDAACLTAASEPLGVGPASTSGGGRGRSGEAEPVDLGNEGRDGRQVEGSHGRKPVASRSGRAGHGRPGPRKELAGHIGRVEAGAVGGRQAVSPASRRWQAGRRRGRAEVVRRVGIVAVQRCGGREGFRGRGIAVRVPRGVQRRRIGVGGIRGRASASIEGLAAAERGGRGRFEAQVGWRRGFGAGRAVGRRLARRVPARQDGIAFCDLSLLPLPLYARCQFETLRSDTTNCFETTLARAASSCPTARTTRQPC
jgi:hypothetical protein